MGFVAQHQRRIGIDSVFPLLLMGENKKDWQVLVLLPFAQKIGPELVELAYGQRRLGFVNLNKQVGQHDLLLMLCLYELVKSVVFRPCLLDE